MWVIILVEDFGDLDTASAIACTSLLRNAWKARPPLVTQPPLARLSKHPTEVCERHGSAGCKSFTTAEARFATE